ncbi:hypothetical protein L6452_12988 [Arctium lappa]|uniref:Uncharacterized protein n=1 Tax=Arctium lappa TaxID=4217 RepID=A0ACB9CH26_ARCLA|nr:hypothetical protein L6452_12988 [Arctium lappa]
METLKLESTVRHFVAKYNVYHYYWKVTSSSSHVNRERIIKDAYENAHDMSTNLTFSQKHTFLTFFNVLCDGQTTLACRKDKRCFDASEQEESAASYSIT